MSGETAGIRLRSGSTSVLLLTEDGPIEIVSVTVGGRVLNAANATVEPVVVVRGTAFTRDVADVLARHEAIIAAALRGALTIEGRPLGEALRALRERCGAEPEALVQMNIAEMLLPLCGEARA